MEITSSPVPGAIVRIRSAHWKIQEKIIGRRGYNVVRCHGLSGLTKSKAAEFVWELEPDRKVLDPAAINLVADTSPGVIDTKLYLASAFRSTHTTSKKPLLLGQAAIDDLTFQHLPVERALSQDRVRLLIADDVGLGKTLEAGMITSELALRGRADRILVVTTRAMLTQFQKEFWTRFSIPLSRLDSAAIRRMRNNIPAHYNVFDQFDRSIVSIDTLKKDGQIRAAIEDSFWDLIIIDEAHNAANRAKSSGNTALRAKLANLLARRTDSLLLLTATPHDGSQESFASLIEMLDPTRVPDPAHLRREDIEDLVVRRFRSSPEIVSELKKTTKQRELHRQDFPLSAHEEAAYEAIAELKLDLDEDHHKGRAIDLFRTTLAKAIFSSPAACLETVEGRIKRIDAGNARGTADDRGRLSNLANLVRQIDMASFSKYQELLALLRNIKWTGKAKRDRLVIFSERIATVSWLKERLQADLGLSDEQVGRVDGGSVEADVKTQETLEAFGQEKSPLRILIASDMASEGLNLHFQCHRLIHFDLPWSLLRFQQRNGRIDRYGQDRNPQIYYFVGESSHPKVRQMWVLDKLVEKDEAVQQGVGDPSVFLGAGDADGEEAVVAESVASGQGAEAFEREMDARAKNAETRPSIDDEYAALFGDYASSPQPTSSSTTPTSKTAPPRLYRDTFAYASAMLERLADPNAGVFEHPPEIDPEDRTIRFKAPADLLASDTLGYADKNTIDDRYMPAEAVSPGGKIELTDRADVITSAIEKAKMQERSWPSVQFLWDGHPMLEWFADCADAFFADHSAPVANLQGRIEPGEVAVILHGAIPNQSGAPVVDRWAVIRIRPSGEVLVEEVDDFIDRARLRDKVPNRPLERLPDQSLIGRAVDAFQGHLVEKRKLRAAEIEEELSQVLERLAEFEARHRSQLRLDFPELDDAETSIHSRRRSALKQAREKKIDQLFGDWQEWFEKTRTMVDDPHPYVDVKAVFVG
ncbi:DEAD/DEAH box helicase [Maricaulis maris]|uniref:DEAD/DEAH box helicase n=1 Tax=Maricaulis maris TaxID=74318 RepID=UPI003B8B8B04